MEKELTTAYEDIPNHRLLTDRELMEQIYELLVAVNMKIDKLGIQKYKEMNNEDTHLFTYPFDDNTISESDDDKAEYLKQTLTDTKEFLKKLFKDKN